MTQNQPQTGFFGQHITPTMSSHQLATTHAEMHVQAASAAKTKSSQTDVSASLLSAATLGFFGFLVHKYLAHRQRLQTRSLSIAIDEQHEQQSHKHGHQHGHKHGHKQEDSLPALVVCGPSGVGKGTLLKMLLEEFGTNRAQYAVSHTTRTPRAGEVNGQHYHFVSASEFEKLIEQGSMLEHAKVHNNYYGRSSVGIQHVVKSGKLCIIEVDVQGAETMKKANLDAHYVFIHPPSFDELSARLVGRGTEAPDVIATRLKNAKDEIEHGENSPIWEVRLVNNDLQASYQELRQHILEWYPSLKPHAKPKH